MVTFCLTNTLTDAKIQTEEAPPMNGWPRFIVIFLQSNRYLWLRAVTFLLTTIFTDAKIQTEEVPPMNGWPRLTT